MKSSLKRLSAETFKRKKSARFLAASTLQIFLASAVSVCAQFPLLDAAAARSSASGQFVVVHSELVPTASHSSIGLTNADWVRLEPALLSVIAERVKQPLWRDLGLNSMSQWRGRIFLALRPAAVPDENISIISTRLAGVWNYRVELPDVLSRAHLARALTGVLLLELANRDNATGRPAEIPAWLTEGFARQLLADSPELIVSFPDKPVNGMLQSRMDVVDRGADRLAGARPVLQAGSVLTFEQLSWPEQAQLNGADGGIYQASAQLLLNNLLALNNGPKNLLLMLRTLPRCYNWQTAFRAAFAADFPQPVDFEKWWDLQAANFLARGPGAQWTPTVSGDRLDELLCVPVEMRSSPANLPTHSAISLQTVIREISFDKQAAIFLPQLRNLQMAEWRMVPPFARLTEAYRRVLDGYFGARNGVWPRPLHNPSKWTVADTLSKLDALDWQRQAMKTARSSGVPVGLSRAHLNAAH